MSCSLFAKIFQRPEDKDSLSVCIKKVGLTKYSVVNLSELFNFSLNS